MDEGQNIKSKLTPAEIQRYKTLLLVKQEEILGNVTTMEHQSLLREMGELSNIPKDVIDAGTDSFEVENVLGLMDSERKLLEQINEALQRIEDGRYGICEGDGEIIPRKRLDAIPWAKYCIDCANKTEKGLVRGETSFGRSGYDYDTDNDDDLNNGESAWRAEKF
ncbi:MAG TPA: TraR/DksA family transcriptional regulator [Sedimentisphaerales bacterium]|nr:TraR/DksA family transcriptional regulator [Sedimentisphaerales bacterium]